MKLQTNGWYVLRAFTFNGKALEIGQPFQAECSDRRLEQLVAGRKLGRKNEVPKPAPKLAEAV